ncbi:MULTISPECIES: hypothetical protein [Actinosynnema]|uniref:hypothetical protein n=1 Tax=Actinosynnema TaxID=40566 RepID=UPI0020A611A7|nr:hypothetical protein [Actinosynnema pretiosum]MCP2095098.1 hypothetical protein [Actinosynnema pretiosum]
MSRESESEQTTRTVAELLAQYGGKAGDDAKPRRRRRRAEEDASETTGPQAIIDRVSTDSGRMAPVREEEVQETPPPAPQRPTPGLPQRPPRRQPQPPPVEEHAPYQEERGYQDDPRGGYDERAGYDDRAGYDERGGYDERTSYQPPVAPPVAPPPPPPPVAPPPPVRRGPAVDPAEETRVVPPIVDDEPPPPPPMPASRRARKQAQAEAQRVAERTALERPVADRLGGAPAASAEATQLDMHGVDVPERPVDRLNPAVRPPAPGRPGAPPREAVTEILPRVPDQLVPNVPLESMPTESVLIVPPAPTRMPEPLPDQTSEDWFGDALDSDTPPGAPKPPQGDRDAQVQQGTEFHEFVDEDEALAEPEDEPERKRGKKDKARKAASDGPAGLSDVDELDEDETPRSPAKEWLVMIGQLAVGVVGGAALWLGFSFLWRTLAPAALVVALAVTVGLVLLVRRIRRADDLGTTILAVLVGLIVTVSPAAMLLVKS